MAGQSGTMAGRTQQVFRSLLLLLALARGQMPPYGYYQIEDQRHLLRYLIQARTMDTWFFVVAPELLRADTQETIYLEASGLTDPLSVSISIMDFTKSTLLFKDSLTLGPEQSYHTLKSIQLSSDLLNPEDHMNKFVYLRVDFEGHHQEERLMLVSFQQGYIFIQTDKPIYNPGELVRMRAYVSSPSFKAFNGSLRVEFQNPEGIAVKQVFLARAVDAVLPENFLLPEHANEGVWAVVAKFDNRLQNTFKAQFQVKKYVLPAFNVTLVPKTPYLTLDQTQLEVAVSASYLYGEPVRGTAYVVFGVEKNNKMKRLPSVKQVTDLETGVATLTMEELRRAHPDISSLVGSSIYVKASVLTTSGGDLVEAMKAGIRIVNTPYILTFSQMPQYYKPGLPLDFRIQLNFQDGSPAQNVPVRVNLLDIVLSTSDTGSLTVSLNMPSTSENQIIKVATDDASLKPEQQASLQATVWPHVPFSRRHQNFLHISSGTQSVTAGRMLLLTLSINMASSRHTALVKYITYLVLSKGRIVQGRRVALGGQQNVVVALTVQPDMRPSFRVLAYYILPWTPVMEVVSDSIWVDMDDGCVGGLNVGPVGGRRRVHTPGETIKFEVKGDPGARVHFVAVDNAVYLLSNQKLTQSKLWNAVEEGDMGCTRGGGRDGMKVFTDAGLLFSSSLGAKTPIRPALSCPPSARRRRSAELLERRAQLEATYGEGLQRRCCLAGLRDVSMPYSCTRRSFYVTEGWECILAFRRCCARLRDQEFDTSRPTTPQPPTTPPPPTTTTQERLIYVTFASSGYRPPSRHRLLARTFSSIDLFSSRLTQVMEQTPAQSHPMGVELEEEAAGGDGGGYMAEYDVYLRSKFFESWLWKDVALPDTAVGRDRLASITMTSALPDSITEWSIMAISASRDTGFCVAKPYNVKAWKSFFVDLKLPHSVARHEQIQIKAVVHNYGSEDLHVRVVLMVTKNICSVAFSEAYSQEIDVAAGAAVAVPYALVPLVVGKLPVQVMVVGQGRSGGDRVEKILRVVLEGVQKTSVRSFVLDPSANGGTQNLRLHKVELDSVVPNSVPLTYINIRGNVLADSIDNSISDDSLASLIHMPGGCVEQNLASMTMPLISSLYLDRTHGWEGVGVQRREEALSYVTRGYEKQLVYRKTDGSYPPYRKEGSSTWITAFVVRVFSMAYALVEVEEEQVCQALRYLMENKMERHGAFREDNPVYSTTMTGGLRGGEAKTTLTAFVLIAVAQARKAGIGCARYTETGVGVDRAAAHLRRALSGRLERPYTVAISAYALTLLGKDQAFDPVAPLLKALSEGSYWADSESALFSLEATGYGLLALLESGHLDEATGPFNWLNSQRRMGGGYGSTQPTMVVLQALSEYLVLRPPGKDLSLWVDLKVPGRSDLRYHFGPDSSFVPRSSRAPLNQEFEVEARGKGQGILEVVTFYNQLHEVEDKSSCPHFELEVAVAESTEKPPADVIKSYQMTIRVRSLGPRDVRMVILDISLPTGFTPDNSDLEMLSNSVDQYINNFQVVDNLSDRGSLIIHLFKVSHKEPEILIFRLQQNFEVGLLQPSSVTVYEYYNPDHRCSRTYSPPEDKVALSQICRNDVCRCTQGDCCVPKSDGESFPLKTRETHACETLHYVYKVMLLSVNQSYYDKYDMEVTQVIKHGLEADVSDGAKRLFMSHGSCRGHLRLQPGSHYFIMGPKDDMWQTDDSYIYMLGKHTWVERWPTAAECDGDTTLRAKCGALKETARELSTEGCRL